MNILPLCLLIVFYVIILFLMKKFTNTKLTNAIFCITIFVLYATFVFVVGLKAGIQDWNFLNTLPVANVSPFMFASMPLYFILPKKVKKYYLTLIALLFVGMFLSVCFSCIYFQSISYKFHFHFLLDYVAHFSLSLWGVYLVKSKQVSLKIKESLIGGSTIVASAVIMMILNVIFDTAFFGLSLNGKHNIYNQVLVSSSYISALIYFSGLIFVLLIGYFTQKLINHSKKNKNDLSKTNES